MSVLPGYLPACEVAGVVRPTNGVGRPRTLMGEMMIATKSKTTASNTAKKKAAAPKVAKLVA